ncbi:FixH family protein [Tabrizicola sp.]|uniref:FixH family protein n=1 Tax=Tabrizicola sp. TaxID=2005166 RepID=UPI002736122C|nr:FixH family protein [Tabrizicola sp.]MDP3197625.1 FixH family protein [Tabrizicola sp.]
MTELKGKHVLAITVSAFAVIIGVNLTLAFKAVSTFPGLEVDNSYVASQGFNARKAAQEALGWTLAPSYDAGRIDLAFLDRDGLPIAVKDLEVLVGRTTSTAADARPQFMLAGDVYTALLDLDQGKWMVKVTARSADGTLFEQRSELFVRG